MRDALSTRVKRHEQRKAPDFEGQLRAAAYLSGVDKEIIRRAVAQTAPWPDDPPDPLRIALRISHCFGRPTPKAPEGDGP